MQRTPNENAFFVLLRVPEMPDATRRIGLLQTRIAALGYGTNCSRCGGTGHYSFNQMYGTVCFKCAGSGCQTAKLTRALYETLTTAVQTGELDVYLANARARSDAKKAPDRVMVAWSASGVSQAYDWRKAAQDIEPDRAIADRFNDPMYHLQDAISKQSYALQHVIRTIPADRAAFLAREETITRLSHELTQATDAALLEIQRLTTELQDFLKEHAS